MIQEKSFHSIAPFIQRLAKANYVLEAEVATPISALTNQTSTVVGDDGHLDVVKTSILTTNSTGPLDGLHNLQFDALVDNAAKSVVRQLHIARNAALPEIEQLLGAAETALNNDGKAIGTDFTVVVDDLPAPMKNDHFISLIEEFKNVNPGGAEQDKVLRFGKRTAVSIVPLFETGFKSLDSDIAQWIATKGEVWLETVWRDFFANDMHAKSGTFYQRCRCQKNGRDAYDIDAIIAVHLIARHLKENVIDESGLSLSEYNNILVRLIRLTGYYLCDAFDKRLGKVSRGILVAHNDVMNKSITVYKENYDKFLAEGGDVDALYGLIVLEDKQDALNVILANADKYRKAWLKHYNNLLVLSNNQRISHLRRILTEEFRKICYGVDASAPVVHEFKDVVSAPDTSFKKFVEMLRDTTDNELQDLEFTVLRLVTRTRYANQDTFFLLSRLDYHHKQNENLDAREAATLATIDYVGDWVAKQMHVKKI